MTTADLSPQEAARWALRAGLPLDAERLDVVAATSNHIHHVVGALRALDFQETPPASTYRPAATAEKEQADGAV
ncbi:hypothetical protein [Streptomyces sp. 8L]|uniref:hypothetical protein n=1 Tax=Streptomyces sp. 8L TaxID=2877242 RepID=UPI001CD36C48|nr:hypothetical protein [Streptomyces sp. 8L]MCA1219797.1 hypothetical protein [Streptomyces sp. 8L]